MKKSIQFIIFGLIFVTSLFWGRDIFADMNTKVKTMRINQKNVTFINYSPFGGILVSQTSNIPKSGCNPLSNPLEVSFGGYVLNVVPKHGLQPNTTYYYRACGRDPDNPNHFLYADKVGNFKTLKNDSNAQVVKTLDSEQDGPYVILKAEALSDSIEEAGFVFDKNQNNLQSKSCLYANEFHKNGTVIMDKFDATWIKTGKVYEKKYTNEFEPSTTYFYQACVEDEFGNKFRGEVKTFETADEVTAQATGNSDCMIDYVEFLPVNSTNLTPGSHDYEKFLLEKGRNLTLKIYAQDPVKCKGAQVSKVDFVNITDGNAAEFTKYKSSLSGTFDASGVITFENIAAGSAVDNGMLDFGGSCGQNTECRFGVSFYFGPDQKTFDSWSVGGGYNMGQRYGPNTEEKAKKGTLRFNSMDGIRPWVIGCRFEFGDFYFDGGDSENISENQVNFHINTEFCKSPLEISFVENDNKGLDDLPEGTVDYLDNVFSYGVSEAVTTAGWSVVKNVFKQLAGKAAANGLIAMGGDAVVAVTSTITGPFTAFALTAYTAYKIYKAYQATQNDDIHFVVDDKEEKNIFLYPYKNYKEITLSFKASEYECEKEDDEPDCVIYADIKALEGGAQFSTFIPGYWDEKQSKNWKTSKSYRQLGLWFGECADNSSCKDDKPWNLMAIQGASTDGSQASASMVGSQTWVDTNSPCYDGNGGYNDNCYEFLAPIQGFDENAKGEKLKNVKSENGRMAITNLSDYQLGDYVNKIFQIAVAILGVISVIMIVIAGVQYMTVESIYGKSDAKQRIGNAVGGLILSVGIYLILWTINPHLLEVNFGSGIKEVKIEVGDAPPELKADGTYEHHLYHYKKGDSWPAEKNWVSIRNELKQHGIEVKNAECQHVGDACTSLYFEPAVADIVKNGLIKLKNESGASKIIVTGGSEYWLHKTHGPKGAKIDIRSYGDGSGDISNLLSGSRVYPAQCYQRSHIKKGNKELDFIDFALDEAKLAKIKNTRANGEKIGETISTMKKISCAWNPAEHWHLSFK